MKLLGREEVELSPWTQSSQGNRREIFYILKGGAWLSKSSDVKISAVQYYKFDT